MFIIGFIQRTSLKNHKKSANTGKQGSFNNTIIPVKYKQNHFAACASIMRTPECNSAKLSCEHCGKCFKRYTAYNVHLKRHLPLQQEEEDEKNDHDDGNDVRMFVCDICNKSYKTKSTLKTHQLTHGAKTFLCSECGKDFATKSALFSHQKVHTREKPYTCGICSKSFAYTGSFDTHMLLHTGVKKYVCKVRIIPKNYPF